MKIHFIFGWGFIAKHFFISYPDINVRVATLHTKMFMIDNLKVSSDIIYNDHYNGGPKVIYKFKKLRK